MNTTTIPHKAAGNLVPGDLVILPMSKGPAEVECIVREGRTIVIHMLGGIPPSVVGFKQMIKLATKKAVPPKPAAPTKKALRWDQVKDAVKAAGRLANTFNKGTANEGIIVQFVGHAKGSGVGLQRYDSPEQWASVLTAQGIPFGPKPKKVAVIKPNLAWDQVKASVQAAGRLHRVDHDGTTDECIVIQDPGQSAGSGDMLFSRDKPSYWAAALKREEIPIVSMPVVTHLAMDPDASPETVAAVKDMVQAAHRYVPPKPEAKRAKKNKAHQLGAVLDDGTMVADPANALQELHDHANAPAAKACEHVWHFVYGTPVAHGIHEGSGNFCKKCGVPATPELVEPGKLFDVPPVPPKPAASLTELAAPFGSDRRQREVVKKRFTSLHGKLAKLPPAERAAFIAYIQTEWP